MNKPNTKCRVCGKEYYCCEDSRKVGSYRTMACSPECYREYIRRIEISRLPKKETVTKNVEENNDYKVTERQVDKPKCNKSKTVDKTETKSIDED